MRATTATSRYEPRSAISASDRPIPSEFDVDAMIGARRARRTPRHALGRAELRGFERALRSSLARLERAMARTRSHRIALRMRGAHMKQESTPRSRSLVVSPRTLARHQELVAAIRRLEAGTYGICVRCGTPIAHEHLTQNPRATLCARREAH
jgi:RNA polymerase-binding transcription factor DksA